MNCELYIDDRFDQLYLPEALDLLPPGRRAKAEAFKFDGLRKQSVAAWLLLRRACQEQLHLPDVPRVETGRHGKPYFPDLPGVHFNLSHCTEAVACAIATVPVGVDIERTHHASEALMRYVLNDEELRRVEQAPNPEMAFVTIWTQKESLLKLSGQGLTVALPPLLEDLADIRFHTQLHPAGRYVCTVAMYASDASVHQLKTHQLTTPN